MEIALFLLAGCLLVYLASQSQGHSMPPPPYSSRPNSADSDHDSAPIINYTLWVADPRSSQWLQIESPADYPHHYGMLNGQYIQLQWQVLHADFVHIEGIGYVQAVGSKDLFPKQATRYRIQARNRSHQAEQQLVVHIFPLPVMELVPTPLPDLDMRIELRTPRSFADRPKGPGFPGIQAPSLLKLREELKAEIPKPVPWDKSIYQLLLDNSTFNNMNNNILNKLNNRPFYQDRP